MLKVEYEGGPSSNYGLFRVWKRRASKYQGLVNKLWLMGRISVPAFIFWWGLVFVFPQCDSFRGYQSLWISLFAVLYTMIRFYLELSRVVEEKLLVLPHIGIQRTSVSASGDQRSDFFHVDSVQSVLINEGISLFSVIFYLVIFPKNPVDKLPLCFPTLQPPLNFLRLVQSEANMLMHLS